MLNSIDKIVSTYNLPPRIRSFVVQIVHRNAERLGLTSFDDQYRYISDLVERFQLPREDRMAIRLDSPAFGDGRTWHDILPDRNHYEEEDEGVTLCEAVGTSYSFLNERQREIQLRLLSDSDAHGATYLRADEIVADYLGIKQRSEEVRRLIEQDIRFRQPGRRFVSVKLDDGFYMRWERRNFKGNPLAFWNEHLDVYERFVEEGRKALSVFDQSLYAALNRCKTKIESGKEVRLIELAIPKKKKPSLYRSYGVNEVVLREIHNAYNLFNGDTTNAARHLHCSRNTIAKYWRKSGLEIRPGGRYLPKEERKKIVMAHLDCDGNASRAATVLPYHTTTILRHWREEGLPIFGRGRPVRRKVHGL